MSEYIGVDISRFNMINNYELICKQCDFVMLRAGGSDNGNPPIGFYKDKFFEERYEKFTKLGVPLGAYWVVGHKFTTEADGIINAKKFIQLLRGKKFSMPVILDYEVPTPEMRHNGTTAAIAFCRQLEKQGYYVSIYASDISGFKDRLELDRLGSFDKWVARYGGSKPKYATQYGIWQYTDNGYIEGVNGRVDINISYKNYPEIIRKAGLNNLK